MAGTVTTLFFENTDGTTVTQANVGASQAPTTNGGTITFAASAKAHGNTGLKFVSTASNQCLCRFAIPNPNTVMGLSTYFLTPSAWPSANCNFLTIRSASAQQGAFYLGTAGAIGFFDKSNAHNIIGPTLSLNTLYRVDSIITAGPTGTGDGQITAHVYAADSTSALGAISNSALNLDNSPFSFFDLGVVSSGVAALTMQIDCTSTWDQATSEIGPINKPYAVPGGNQTVRSSAAVALDGSGSFDPDNNPITSYAWVIVTDPTGQATLSNANTATPTLHTPAVSSNTNIVVGLTVTS